MTRELEELLPEPVALDVDGFGVQQPIQLLLISVCVPSLSDVVHPGLGGVRNSPILS